MRKIFLNILLFVLVISCTACSVTNESTDLKSVSYVSNSEVAGESQTSANQSNESDEQSQVLHESKSNGSIKSDLDKEIEDSVNSSNDNFGTDFIL